MCFSSSAAVCVTLMLPYFSMWALIQMAGTNTDTSHTQRHDGGLNASIRLGFVFGAVDSLLQRDSDGFFYTLWKMGQPSWLLHWASPLAARSDPGGMRTRRGTKHSISASDITAVSSAVSACAINSVAERADCLCRKYLTPDPEPWEK